MSAESPQHARLQKALLAFPGVTMAVVVRSSEFETSRDWLGIIDAAEPWFRVFTPRHPLVVALTAAGGEGLARGNDRPWSLPPYHTTFFPSFYVRDDDLDRLSELLDNYRALLAAVDVF